MPIPINYRTMPISPEDVKTILQAETDSFGTFFNLDRMLQDPDGMEDGMDRRCGFCHNIELPFPMDLVFPHYTEKQKQGQGKLFRYSVRIAK